MILRPGTSDQYIYNSVYVGNEYRVPERMDGQRVLDVGGHIGTFALKCAERGATVVSCEPCLENRTIFLCNTLKWRKSIELLPVAVGATARTARLAYCPMRDNLAAHTLVLHPWVGLGEKVQVVPIDELGEWDWIKLDCEGSEYEIVDREIMSKRLTVEFHIPHRLSESIGKLTNQGWHEVWRERKTDKVRWHSDDLVVVDFVK